MIRLRGEPGTIEFLQAYKDALSDVGIEKKQAKHLSLGALEWLIKKYYDSAEFQALDRGTQRTRHGILKSVLDGHSEKPFARLEPKHIRALRDEKKWTPEAANNRLKALKQVFKFAVDHDYMRDNPAKDVPKLKGKVGGWHSWTLDEVQQFEERHSVGTKARLALALLLYTAQRRSDVVLMGRQHVRDGWLTLTQQKNRNRNPTIISIPIIPELQHVIESSPTGDMTFLITTHGKGFTAAGFGNWFRERCDEAHLPHCSAHGLRKAAAARLAEKGCSANEIMAITGHRSLAEAQRYVAGASQKLLAKAAMKKLTSAN